MKRIMRVLITALAIGLAATGAQAGFDYRSETPAQKAERMRWFTDARFGMFIHFGLYAMPARHEWVRNKEWITNEEYEKYFRKFDPDLFDAGDLARRAKAAGMKYAVLTTKHHEGFCLWDSAHTDYKSTRTPGGRDYVREFVDAFRAEGLHVGFYYSLLDWHHPDFTVDGEHPLRPKSAHLYKDMEGWSEERFAETFGKLNRGRDMARYRQYMKDQVRELLTNYGRIDILWYDFSYPDKRLGKGAKDWGSEELLALTRELQPQIIVNNRLDLLDKPWGWDFITPEQMKVKDPIRINGVEVAWETCQTFSGSWGYYRDEMSWKNPAQLVELLAHSVSCGGNLIMNVGPTSRGDLDDRACAALDVYAKWMRRNARAIYGCTRAPDGFEAPYGTLLTYNPKTNRLYIHLADYPLKKLDLDFTDRIDYAQFLHDGSELRIVPPKKGHPSYGGMMLSGGIEVPVMKPNVEIPVIECFLK